MRPRRRRREREPERCTEGVAHAGASLATGPTALTYEVLLQEDGDESIVTSAGSKGVYLNVGISANLEIGVFFGLQHLVRR